MGFAVWMAITVAGGRAFDAAWLSAIGPASTVVVYMLVAYDRRLWRAPGLRRLTTRPVLNGTWRAVLRTTFADRAEEEIECYLVIRESYSRVRVSVLFDRSQSHSLSADISLEDGQCVLFYLFRTEARTLHRDGNPPRRGGAALVVARQPHVHLEGDYWTEGETRGSIATTGRSDVLYETFSSAQQGDYR
jgi:hypothetical protein